MLKLGGVIGTGWITKQFVEATQEVGGWQLTSVFSRNLERASAFAADFAGGEIKGYRDLDTFFAEGDFDVVYIASPNSLHFAQARQAILADKHVIVEKPACSNPNEMKVLIRLLRRKHHIFYFEAARHFHEPNFKAAERQLRKMKTLQGATLTYLNTRHALMTFWRVVNPTFFLWIFLVEHCKILGGFIWCMMQFLGLECRKRQCIFHINYVTELMVKGLQFYSMLILKLRLILVKLLLRIFQVRFMVRGIRSGWIMPQS